jgi:hypothetical protein
MTGQAPPEHEDTKDPRPELGLAGRGRRKSWRLAAVLVAAVLLLLYLVLRSIRG